MNIYDGTYCTVINGSPVSYKDLKMDVEVAKANGYSNAYAFTPETVEGLLTSIEQLLKHAQPKRVLINGCIPAYTECPFKDKCRPTRCHHKGKKHEVPFSCGFARAYDLIESKK